MFPGPVCGHLACSAVSLLLSAGTSIQAGRPRGCTAESGHLSSQLVWLSVSIHFAWLFSWHPTSDFPYPGHHLRAQNGHWIKLRGRGRDRGVHEHGDPWCPYIEGGSAQVTQSLIDRQIDTYIHTHCTMLGIKPIASCTLRQHSAINQAALLASHSEILYFLCAVYINLLMLKYIRLLSHSLPFV